MQQQRLEPQELAVILAGVNVFSGLDEEQLAELAACFSEARVPAGGELMTEGQKNTKLSVIIEGNVRIFLPQGDDRFSDVNLANMGPGELFGEYSFVDMRPASASVEATSDCSLLQIEYSDLYRILDGNAPIARRFYENLLLVLIDRLRADDRELDLVTLA